MKRPIIPRVEALVAITATSVRYRLMIEGMNYISQHDTSPRDEARDQETKEAVLATFPPSWRAAIFVAHFLGDTFNIELKPPISEEAALAIGRAFEKHSPVLRSPLTHGLPLRRLRALCARLGLRTLGRDTSGPHRAGIADGLLGRAIAPENRASLTASRAAASRQANETCCKVSQPIVRNVSTKANFGVFRPPELVAFPATSGCRDIPRLGMFIGFRPTALLPAIVATPMAAFSNRLAAK